MARPEPIDLNNAEEISLKADGLLKQFSARWKKWDAADLAVNKRQNAAQKSYPACDEAFKESTARTDAVSSLARLQAGFGFKEKEQLAALRQAGLTIKTPAALAQVREDLAYAMRNPLLAMRSGDSAFETDRVPLSVLNKYNQLLTSATQDPAIKRALLKETYYKDVAKLLENSRPGWLSRTFSPGRAEEINLQLNALAEYALQHKRLHEQHKAVEEHAQEAEKNTANALYRTLKSSAWKKLAAEGPDGILFQKLQASNNPAAKLLLDLASADLRRSWYGTATPALKEIKAALSRLPESVDLRDVTALFREIERDSRRETEQARALREQAGLERRDADIRAKKLERLIAKDFRGTVGGRRVDLAEQLEKLVKDPKNFNAKTRDEILRAAEKAQRSWRETPVIEFYRSLERKVPHGIVPDTARVLSNAARAVFTPVGAAARFTAAHVPDKDGLTHAFNTASNLAGAAKQYTIRVVGDLWGKASLHSPWNGAPAAGLA